MGLENRTCFLVNLRDGLRCRQCGQSPTQQAEYHRGFEYHHVIPRSQGGSDLPENIALLCHACHQGQHARKLAESIAGVPLIRCGLSPQCEVSVSGLSQTIEGFSKL